MMRGGSISRSSPMAALSIAVWVALLHAGTGFAETPEGHVSCRSDDRTAKILTFLDFVAGVVKEAKEKAENPENGVSANGKKPVDCADLKEIGRKNGVHKIWPMSRVVHGPIDVMCDMTDDGGGWTVIQRRGDFNSHKDYFYRDWNSYKNGFGNIRKDFWLGNDVIFALTNQRACSIKVLLADWDGNSAYAMYDDFWIDDEWHNYTLHVSGYRGTAGDSFSDHNEMPFATKDRHNNINPSNCAVDFKGAWWYNKCHHSNLNGLYHRGAHDSFADGVNWKAYKEYKYSLKDTFMMIRPKSMN